MEVLVEYDYKAEEPDELTIKKGDIIKEVAQFEDGWFIGKLNGKFGVFPDNFVKILDPSTKNVNQVESNSDKTLNSGRGDTNASPVLSDRVKACYVYQPKRPDELELQVDDVIQVLDRSLPDEGWWQGKNLRTRKVGVFPDNFVVPLVSDTSAEQNQLSSPNVPPPAKMPSPCVNTQSNGVAPTTVHLNRPNSTIVSAIATSPTSTISCIAVTDPPKVAAKPVLTSSTQPGGGVKVANVTSDSAFDRDKTKVAVSNAPGRMAAGLASATVTNATVAETNDKAAGITRSSSHLTHADRNDIPERLKSGKEESTNEHVTQRTDGGIHRLTSLTADRPRQSGRRLPSKFAGSIKTSSDTPADMPDLSETPMREHPISHSHSVHVSRGTPIPQDGPVSAADISEQSRSAASNRNYKVYAKQVSLNRSEGGSGSADFIRSPESNESKSSTTDTANLSLAKLHSQTQQLQLQHNQLSSETKQHIKDMCCQIEQLQEVYGQVRLDLLNGQRLITERLQSLTNEMDELKKQNAADAVELTRLRTVLMRLDANALLATTEAPAIRTAYPNDYLRRRRSGDRFDEHILPHRESDAQSLYDEDDEPIGPRKSTVNETQSEQPFAKNGDVSHTTAPISTVYKPYQSRNAPALRPRPSHPASYSKI